MSELNVISLAEYRENCKKSKKPAKGAKSQLIENIEKNVENELRIRRERENKNKSVLRSYRIKG